ncbi:MAG: hypothetical protein E7Z64_06955 [Thermoplasmata archaeon]|nr:hypothetical protein [Thermoplasmata archaeon]
MGEAANLRKAPTGKSGLGLILLAIGIIALIGLIAWALMDPDILEATMTLILFIGAAILIIAVLIMAAMILLAIPMYVKKGETYQVDIDYSLDDVKPVKESSSEDKKNE